MDEFALFKGHDYATIVIDADRKRVLWVCEGRNRGPAAHFLPGWGRKDVPVSNLLRWI
jgi:transposase